jgi:hypothetical protein
MPRTFNGFGTAVRYSRGKLKLDGRESFDAIECFVCLFLPVVPYRALHTFDWQGNQYRIVPIRWSFSLVVRALISAWLWLPFLAGVIWIVVSLSASQHDDTLPLAAGLVVFSIVGWVILYISDQRTRRIRTLIGPHSRGTSDPADWETADIELVLQRLLTFGQSPADAVQAACDEGDFSKAMLVARSRAGQDSAEGRMLTKRVLAAAP